MNIAIPCLAFICILAASAEAQEIASVDLTRLSTTPKSTQARTLPRGCRELAAGGIADGLVLPPKEEPLGVTVEIANLASDTFATGTVVQAEIRLRNSGKYPIRIPWSADPAAVDPGRDPSHERWEQGSFTFALGALGKTEFLKNMAQPLYGSSLAKGTQIEVLPGRWVTAKVGFQLELEYPIPGRSINKGEQQLHVEWEQVDFTRDVKDCAVTSGFFRYRGYYHQQNPVVMIKVN